MTRRYGRVTVEGWIADAAANADVFVGAEDGTDNIGCINRCDAVTVEYLPQPVVFNDGDVVRYLDDYADVLVRVDGAWRCNRIHIGTAPHTDAEIAHALTAGLAVRLVEATP